MMMGASILENGKQINNMERVHSISRRTIPKLKEFGPMVN